MLSQTTHPATRTWWTDLIFITFSLGLLYFTLLGERPLFVPDEGRYAEIIREMLEHQDYLTPHLNGVKYFEKPVLFYWLGALTSHIFGLSVSSLRLVNALLSILGCLIVYLTGRTLHGRTAGLLSAFILGTSLLYTAMGHIINLDMTVTVFLTCTFCFFLLGAEGKGRYYFWLAATTAAFAILTKGLIGIVFPLMVIGTWVLLFNKWHEIKHWHLLSSILLLLAIALPWHLAVQQHNTEFFHIYFIEQHVLRFTDPKIGHPGPFWYFIPCLILGFFPWIVFLPQTIKSSIRQRHPSVTVYYLLWAMLIFAFFSFSKSKLISYILPVLPPLALLTGCYLSQALRSTSTLSFTMSWIVLIFYSTLLTCACFFFLHNSPLPEPALAKIVLGSAALVLLFGIFISSILGMKQPKVGILSTITVMTIFLFLAIKSVPAIDTRSILPLATIINSDSLPEDEVITYNQYYQDLPFYINRQVTILNWQNELSTGMKHQDTHEWMINDTEFAKRWHSKRRVYVILSRDEFESFQKKYPRGKALGKTINNILVRNH